MRLIFVYNANSGKGNALLDSLHKIVSPQTYDCKLCELTFGLVSEKRRWKQFRKKSGVDMLFLHKDEFQKEFRSKWLPKYDFPVILINEGSGLEIFALKADLEELTNTEALIEFINSRLVRG